jgi:hypothetical protein
VRMNYTGADAQACVCTREIPQRYVPKGGDVRDHGGGRRLDTAVTSGSASMPRSVAQLSGLARM